MEISLYFFKKRFIIFKLEDLTNLKPRESKKIRNVKSIMSA